MDTSTEVRAEWSADGDTLMVRSLCTLHDPPSHAGVDFGNVLAALVEVTNLPGWWYANDELFVAVAAHEGCHHVTPEAVAVARGLAI